MCTFILLRADRLPKESEVFRERPDGPASREELPRHRRAWLQILESVGRQSSRASRVEVLLRGQRGTECSTCCDLGRLESGVITVALETCMVRSHPVGYTATATPCGSNLTASIPGVFLQVSKRESIEHIFVADTPETKFFSQRDHVTDSSLITTHIHHRATGSTQLDITFFGEKLRVFVSTFVT